MSAPVEELRQAAFEQFWLTRRPDGRFARDPVETLISRWRTAPLVAYEIGLQARRQRMLAEARQAALAPAAEQACRFCGRQLVNGACPAHTIDCTHDARIRLGVSDRRARAMRAREWTQAIEARRERKR